MIRVFHNSNFLSAPFQEDPTENMDLTLVADVDTDELEEAFMFTQNIDHPWVINKGVSPFVLDQNIRSTSMGDVFEKDGRRYLVDSIGFRSLITEDA